MREIGSGYDPTTAGAGFLPQVFPNDFDLLLFIAQTSPSTLLPFLN